MLDNIKKAVAVYEAAKEDLKRVIKEEQKDCPHKRVLHGKWKSSDWGSPFRARRLCLDCGLEEEAGNSGWGDNDGDFKKLKTGGFHKVVEDHYQIYNARFPHADVDVSR